MIRHVGMSLLVAAGAAPGCLELVHVEARASEVCLTGVRLDVPGAAIPEGADAWDDLEVPDAVEASYTLEDPAAELPAELDASAQLTGVAVTAVEGVEDFGFLRRVQIDLEATGLARIAVVDIGEDERAMFEGADRWFLAAGADVDLIDYLLADELVFELVLEGEMPEEDWAVELDVCVAGTARYAAGL